MGKTVFDAYKGKILCFSFSSVLLLNKLKNKYCFSCLSQYLRKFQGWEFSLFALSLFSLLLFALLLFAITLFFLRSSLFHSSLFCSSLFHCALFCDEQPEQITHIFSFVKIYRSDAGHEGYRKGGMQDRWDAGLEGCKKGGLQERRNSRDEGCKFSSAIALI